MVNYPPYSCAVLELFMSLLSQLFQLSYTRLGSLAAQAGTFAYTGYSVRQILAKDEDDESTQLGKRTLSGLYILHMSAMALTAAVMLGQADVSPAVATALVGLTSLLKGYAELHNEQATANDLKLRKESLETQLKQRNFEFERMLIVLEDLNECEHELKRQEEHLGALRKNLHQLQRIKNDTPSNTMALKKTFSELKSAASEQHHKAAIIRAYFQEIPDLNQTADQRIRELAEKAVATHTKTDLLLKKTGNNPLQPSTKALIDKHESDLDKIGILRQQLIKYKKMLGTILKCEGQLKQTDALNSDEIRYLKCLLEDKQTRAGALLTPEQSVSSKHLANMTIEQLSDKELLGLKSWVCQQITAEIAFYETKAMQYRQHFIHKQVLFQRLSGALKPDLPSDFASMFHNLKKTVDIHNQLSMTLLNEVSKKTNVNFTTITAILALLLCVVPNGEYGQYLQPTKLGIGFAAGASSMWNLHQKYLLKQKLSQAENKRLKRLLHDHGHHVFANIHDPFLRQHLIESLNVVVDGNGNNKPPEQFVPRHARIAKEKAKVLLFHQTHQPRNSPNATSPTSNTAKKSARLNK